MSELLRNVPRKLAAGAFVGLIGLAGCAGHETVAKKDCKKTTFEMAQDQDMQIIVPSEEIATKMTYIVQRQTGGLAIRQTEQADSHSINLSQPTIDAQTLPLPSEGQAVSFQEQHAEVVFWAPNYDPSTPTILKAEFCSKD